ncbi:MAG: cell surface protein SprA [Tannerellaceae bacterium]|nr:cell surface protein SprA [Tannerellaceae bacterium]
MPKCFPKYLFWIVISILYIFSKLSLYAVPLYCIPEEQIEEPDSLGRFYPFFYYPFESLPGSWESYADIYNLPELEIQAVYDPARNGYLLYSSVYGVRTGVPLFLTSSEYLAYRTRCFRRNYYRERNRMGQTTVRQETFLHELWTPNRKKEGPFGNGGLRFRLKGTAEVLLGVRQTRTHNPSLPVRSRRRTYFDLDEKIQVSLQAEMGTKLRFDMQYNTEALYKEDSRKIKLSYTGEEDEFIRLLEAGEVRMTTQNSLIQGGSGLFGIKGNFQFGKLRLNSVIAQQESSSRRIRSSGTTRRREFEVAMDAYEENAHFFLAHYFYDQYDQALQSLPYVQSGIRINRIEVWVTNQDRTLHTTRNLVAFSDLGEATHISHPEIIPFSPSGAAIPVNRANTLYDQLLTTYSAARSVHQVTHTLHGVFMNGKDFEKIENARLLDSSEYHLNEQLGYISLLRSLRPEESLAVAFEYSYQGNVYQVGEFSTDRQENMQDCLFVKLVKGNSLSPSMPFWRLMMKNIYSLPVLSIRKEDFRMEILSRDDSTAVWKPYYSPGNEKNENWLQVLGFDRLDQSLHIRPDGVFDLLEGYTMVADRGRIIFPVVEPFGSHFIRQLGSEQGEYYQFRELYDSTRVYARQLPEKKRFLLRGEYRSTATAEISLGAIGVTPGTVQVSVGGRVLTEQIDYVVDYISGTVTLLNEEVIYSGEGVEVMLEGQSVFASQRKTLLGMELNYDITDHFTIGGTVMHLSERPVEGKTRIGEEAVKNTLWGLHSNWAGENNSLLLRLNQGSWLNWKKPFRLGVNAEFARLKAGEATSQQTGDDSYLDDFESSHSRYELGNPYLWYLSATPYQDSRPLFPEASRVNDITYNMNRALLAWYTIDGIFTRKNSSLMPAHLKNDKEQLSNHYVRDVYWQELFPTKETGYGEAGRMQIMNIAFYPEERGPYNLDTEGMGMDGKLLSPEKRWGGMMRSIEWSNFEEANIEYIEFWMLDPFIYDRTEATGGDLYINLGDISEDILKDEKKFFENGLPVDDDPSKTETTVWGRVPVQSSGLYAFENNEYTRGRQDTGLDGLLSEDEKIFPTYRDYLEKVVKKISPETRRQWETDPFSPLNDPAGDDFHHYRGSDFDRDEVDILSRYKRYNGTEGNARGDKNASVGYETVAGFRPDVEDIDNDFTMNEQEKYYEYKLSVRPADLVPGSNFISDSRTATVELENGNREEVTWYQVKIPVKHFTARTGNIHDFSSIRFMRLYLTGFHGPVVLRLANFGLVRGEWRLYEQSLTDHPFSTSGTTAEVSSVSLEENSERTPVNYVLPPGIVRYTDPTQPQLTRQNEQALSVKVKGLQGEDVRAVYRTGGYDIRHYERIQLFVHAEALPADETGLQNGDISLFMRLGSDFKNNYYEYELPLTLTPPGSYSTYNQADRQTVWPAANQLDILLSFFTTLKQMRNASSAPAGYQEPFRTADPDNLQNTYTVCGNPSLSDISVVLIGLRNNTQTVKQIEVWINELRVTGYKNRGGWATKGEVRLDLSELGTLYFAGQYETAGFGRLDQSVTERRMEDYSQYQFSANLDMGKLLPEKMDIRLPFYYSYRKEFSTPQYNPFDPDILLKESVHVLPSKHQKDSLKNSAVEKNVTKSIAFQGVRAGIRSRIPMPYDPANFTFAYVYSESQYHSPEILYENTRDHRALVEYTYNPTPRAWQPGHTLPAVDKYRYLRQLSFFYLPAHIGFVSLLTRHYEERAARIVYDDGYIQPPVTFQQEFLWQRSFSLRWNLTHHLVASFQSGTQARIEEPYMQVNRKLNPDRYQVWRDSVRQSLLHLGQPLAYDQDFSVTWQLPFALLPALNWMQGTAGYQARYNWDRVPVLADTLQMGNRIRNQRSVRYQGSINWVQLYNKHSRLSALNRSPAGSERNSFSSYLIRLLMMLRRITLMFEKTEGMTLSGFLPEAGDLFGQKKSGGQWMPGWKFAFGEVSPGYLREAWEKEWILRREDVDLPALNRSVKWAGQFILEPVPGLRVELAADRVHTRTTQFQYLYPDLPDRYGGSLTMSTIAIRTLFKKSGSVTDNWYSAPFEQFLAYRPVVAQRIETVYKHLSYPSTGFLSGSSFSEQPFLQGTVSDQSAGVLVPAFLASYRGKDPGHISLSPFPKGFLPNWRIVYETTTQLHFLRNYFQSFLLTHQYRGMYQLNSYSSFLNWVRAEGEKGFVPASQSDPSPVPSSPWSISSVTLADGFTPLIGIDATLQNQVSLSFHYNRSRNLLLSITSGHLSEGHTREYRWGTGYRTLDLHKLLPRLRRSREAHEVNIRLDFNFRKTVGLLRRIEGRYSQLASGMTGWNFHLKADYQLTRQVKSGIFLELTKEIPLLSETSWPSSSSYGGISLMFTLN